MSSEADTRDRILDAARTVLRERGTAGARMQEIADAAGVNKALLHYYFRNKETLSSAVFRRELQRLVQPVLGTLASGRPLREKVGRVVELYMDHLSAMPGLPGYVLAELTFHPDRIPDFMASVVGEEPAERVEPVLATLDRQIGSEVAAGRMRPITAAQFAVNLIALCVFPFAARPLIEAMILGDHDFDDFIDQRREGLPAFFLGGVRP